ncbi:dihydropteroate synthase [Prochlorococcus sp. MIT 1341]|uniref:dihydropteroate synthase n=1 Tax=Prochlorococcus sp. MIT 1341 TaxID=3096221 RepID=UPI002A759812|nr:dihydropteroate synthase [Prochlorococcus sp. MIT 1341]
MKWPKGWGTSTSIMGVINLTPDSFSDGGVCLNPEKALQKATFYLENGASVLDLGAQSTRPGAKEITPEEELKRLIPALKVIRSIHKDSIISVDTFCSVVAEKALEEGADWINDVSGGRRDPNLLRSVAQVRCPYVLTHSRGDSQSMNDFASYDDVVVDVLNELFQLTEKALKSGITVEQIIWDPGLGFAKNTEHNLIILQHLEMFVSEGFPVLIGPSRKRFIGEVLNQSDPLKRNFGTAAVVCRCFQSGISMVRVHDVASIRDTIEMAGKIWPKMFN